MSVIANVEEHTDTELVSILKETLTRVGTGMPIDEVNEQYKIVYRELDERLRRQNEEHPNHFEDLWEFYEYWKENNLSTYASRRGYVRTLYRPSSTHGAQDAFWQDINAVIKTVAKPRFDSGHYSDAVESCFKEINSRIKEVVRQKTGQELDGSSLMNTAFSVGNPIIALEDLSTEDGKNIQKGYMQIFAGAMTGIRNPKAHSNLEIDKAEAIPLIQLASLLFTKFEFAMKETSGDKEPVKLSSKAGVYIRLKNPDDHEALLSLKKILTKYPGSHSVILVLGDQERSAIRLPMKVKRVKALTDELVQLLGAENVAERD
jgi:uncharacterized protein (TIGR02391 family)